MKVSGTIPPEVDGTFYRVMPDPQLPPFIENDPVRFPGSHCFRASAKGSQWFNGDGNVSAFRICNGRVNFKQRYVRTEKFMREREAQRALIGEPLDSNCYFRRAN